MKLLSHQETNFLLNPDKFNRNYQYVLTHRIKNKMEDVDRDLDFIKRNKRALLRNNQKGDYDEHQESERLLAEHNRTFRSDSKSYYTPNFRTVMNDLKRKIRQCDWEVETLGEYLTWDKFIQKHKTMDEKGKQAIDGYIKQMEDKLQEYIDKLEACRKNLNDGYLISDSKFGDFLKRDYIKKMKKWDKSEL